MRRILPLLVLAVLPALASPKPAHAILYTVNFTVLADPNDPSVAYQPGATGVFTFDYDNLILQDLGNGIFRASQSNMETALSFIWDQAWTEQNVAVNFLDFDLNGALLGASLSGYSSAYPENGTDPDFYLNLATPNSNSEFGYVHVEPVIIIIIGGGAATTPTDRSFFTGSVVSWSSTGPTPVAIAEPGTVALLVPGLLPLGLILRRRKQH